MIKCKYFLYAVNMILLLTGCTASFTSSSGIGGLAYLDNGLYLCGDHVRRLDLFNNSTEDFSVPCERILITKRSQIWVITPSHQAKVFDGKIWKDIDIPRVGDIEYLSETRDGIVWFSSSLLSNYDSRAASATVIVPAIEVPPATPAPVPGELAVTLPSEGRIGPVFEAADSTIWYNQQFDGLVQWDRASGKKRIWRGDDGFQGSAPVPTKIMQSHDGYIWIGTDTGVYRLKNNFWQTWVFPGEDSGGLQKNAMGDYRVIDLLEDHNGNVWTVFSRAGVAMWNGSEWRSVGNFQSPAVPSAVFEDSSSNIWIGAIQHDVAKYQNNTIREYLGVRLTSFLETPDHQLFGGGPAGLFLYDEKNDQWTPYPEK